MSRKSIFTAPEKLKICKSLEQGASISQLARSLSVGLTTLEKWRKEYQYYGEEAFKRPTGNRSYSKEFKEQVVLEYYRDSLSCSELAGKYQISYSVIASWVEAWDNGVNLSDYHINPGVYAMASRKTTPQERTEIVQWVLDHDLNYAAAAEQFQIKYATIYRWTRLFIKEGDAGLDKKIGRKPNQAVDPESLSETERLKWELEVLKRKNYRLELENQVLKKKRRTGKSKTHTQVRLSVEFEIIEDFSAQGHPMNLVCEILGVSKAAYYKNRRRQDTAKQRQDELLVDWIRYFHEKYRQILGYRRMTMYVNRELGTTYSEGYIHRLMQVHGIKFRIRRKKVNRKRTKLDYVAENILNRDFEADSPNTKWLTDVTEMAIPNDSRKVFLSPILDLHGYYILAYKVSFRNNNQLVYEMFEQARQKYPKAKPLFHDDRGFQYTSLRFKKMLEDAGMTHSMSRPGKCIDNGPMEAFFGILKSEMFHGREFESMNELIQEIHKYIDFYNNDRLQKGLGCLSPAEYRRQASQS